MVYLRLIRGEEGVPRVPMSSVGFRTIRDLRSQQQTFRELPGHCFLYYEGLEDAQGVEGGLKRVGKSSGENFLFSLEAWRAFLLSMVQDKRSTLFWR